MDVPWLGRTLLTLGLRLTQPSPPCTGRSQVTQGLFTPAGSPTEVLIGTGVMPGGPGRCIPGISGELRLGKEAVTDQRFPWAGAGNEAEAAFILFK